MTRLPERPPSSYPWSVRLLFMLQKWKTGRISEPLLLWGRSPKLLFSFLRMWRKFNRKISPLPNDLRSLVALKVSQCNNCAFCIDLHTYLLTKGHVEKDKVEALVDFENSPLFTQLEKTALNYAIAVTKNSETAEENTLSKLKNLMPEDAIVELTALICFQNLSSKFNRALGAISFQYCFIPSKK